MIDVTGMRAAAAKVQAIMPGHGVMLNAASVVALIEAYEAATKEQARLNELLALISDSERSEALALRTRLAEVEGEHDQARRHLGYSERVLIGLLGKAREGLERISLMSEANDQDLSHAVRCARTLHAEIEAALTPETVQPAVAP